MATTGGRALLLVLSVMGVSAQVGCGKAQRPFNKKSNGVVVQTESKSQEEVQALFPANKVTIVSREDNIYQIQDAKLVDVQERMPASYAEEDIYINMKDPGFDVNNRETFSKRASIEEALYKLDCKLLPFGGPAAKLQLTNEVNLVAQNTVEVGSAALEFRGEGTLTQAAQQTSEEGSSIWNPLKGLFKNPFATAPEVTASTIKLSWVVEPPPGSTTLTEATGSKISVNPDRPGGYFVALIVQDTSTKACDLAGVMVGATHNKKFVGGIGNKGQYNAQKYFHVPLVNGEEAWQTTQGEGVTIAIIDSGVNYNHPDLSENIKINEKEVAGNGVDDDKNGFIDDVYGWDFAIGDQYPYDDESHGTHVAGLAASSVSGIAKKAKILPVKAMLPSGSGSLASIVSAIYYAVKQDVDVINMSLGGEGKASPMVLAAIKKAKEKGIIIVAASGNETINTDVVESFLTSNDGSNVLAIAATDEVDSLTDYSNYGLKTIDIAAPGGTRERPLWSTYAQTDLSSYIAYPGTSMASPLVAGIAALVKSVNPDLTAEQVRAIIMNSGRSSAALRSKLTSGKVVDAAAAVRAASNPSIMLSAVAQ